jgi:hypothetical protein
MTPADLNRVAPFPLGWSHPEGKAILTLLLYIPGVFLLSSVFSPDRTEFQRAE